MLNGQIFNKSLQFEFAEKLRFSSQTLKVRFGKLIVGRELQILVVEQVF